MLDQHSSKLLQEKKCKKKVVSWIFHLLFILAIMASTANAGEVTAKKADDFVDSMGINIKLDRGIYNNNWSQVKSRFKELGIWHYRDGLKLVNNSSTYRSRYQQLRNEAGAIGLFVWGPWENQGKPVKN